METKPGGGNSQNMIFQPKTIIIHRSDIKGFGFTLRHFIAYPPEEWQSSNPSASVQTKQMETVFIKEIHPNGPAHLAGLHTGDRILMVNNAPIAGVPYSTIVSAIKQTPRVLILQIVPKECDVLQMYYSGIAHNPETNRQPITPVFKKGQGQSNTECDLQNTDVAEGFSNGLKVCCDETTNNSVTNLRASTIQTDLNNYNEFIVRLRKSIEQKEEFLKSPIFDANCSLIHQKEFYSRPNRITSVWPPLSKYEDTRINGKFNDDSDDRKIFIFPDSKLSTDTERKIGVGVKLPSSPEVKIAEKINSPRETENRINVVSERRKQFECNCPFIPDGRATDKSTLHRSELSCIQTKLPVPVVTIRKQEIETKMVKLLELDRAIPTQSRNSKQYSANSSLEVNEISEVNTERILQKPQKGNDQFLKPFVSSAIFRRRKSDSDENKPMRRISYLKATSNDVEIASDVERNRHCFCYEPQPDKTGNEKESLASKVLTGKLYLKVVFAKGKRSHVKSWKLVDVELINNLLKIDLGNEAKTYENLADLFGAIDVAGYNISEYEETKRKNVFKLTTKPHRQDSDGSSNFSNDRDSTQILLQTENTSEMETWLKALCEISYRQYLPSSCSEKSPSIGRTKHTDEKHKESAVSALLTTPEYHEPVPSNVLPTNSPKNKSRKYLSHKEVYDKPMGSPKSKNWKDLLFRRIHHGSDHITISSTCEVLSGSIGVPLKECPMSKDNEFVPYLVELCTKIVETKGLNVVGIYRIPGNKAAISELKEQVNRNEFWSADAGETKWDDVNVVSSLLKLFIRSLPDALLPNRFYINFIEADKLIGADRLIKLRSLIKALPNYSYETLKYILRHLRRVSDNCKVNLMEPKNLAIIFGPSIVRTPNETLEIAVKDMKHQCRIVELLVSEYEYFFENGPFPICNVSRFSEIPTSNSAEESTNLLLDNVAKIENFQSEKESSARFLPHLLHKGHTKRRTRLSANFDTYSAVGDSVLSFESQRSNRKCSESSEGLENMKIDFSKLTALADDESLTSIDDRGGSMSLATITDTLETKLQNLRSSPVSSDQGDSICDAKIGMDGRISISPFELVDSKGSAYESSEKIIVPKKHMQSKPIPKKCNIVLPATSAHSIARHYLVNTPVGREIYSDDSEVSTTSDPKESIILSRRVAEKCRKRKGHKLFRSASFNCRNSSGRTVTHNSSSHLTKDEKTDMNITKKRQIQNKQNRSIKRRHTVGGPNDYPPFIGRRVLCDEDAHEIRATNSLAK